MLSCGVIPYPVVSWYWCRSSIAGLILERFPKDFGTYYEPMVGGGGIFLSVQHYPAVIADKNTWLMDTYWAIKEDHRRVGAILESLAPTRETYDRVRRIDPRNLDVSVRAANLIFLSNLAFKNDFRVNMRGHFNVPFGSKPFVYSPENLKAISASLSGVKIESGDFAETVKTAQHNDFVCFDPPRQDKRVSVYSGVKGKVLFRFTQKDYLRLGEVCGDLDKRGVKWAVVDNNTPTIRLYLHKFNIIDLVRSKKDNEIEIALITNYTT